MNTYAVDSVAHAGHGGAPTFAQLWSPGLLIVFLLVGILYTLAVGRWRERFAVSEPVSLKQRLLFWCGLALWYIAEGSPLSYYGHHEFFSIHMLQQSFLYLVMPPFLLLGVPSWMFRAMIKGNAGDRFMRLFTAPFFSLFFFNFIFSVYHIPIVMDWLMANPPILFLYKIVFMIAAFQLWFPIFCPLPEYNRLSDLKRIGYIFLNGILLTPACALIIFAREPLYTFYAEIPATIWFLDTVADQQFGGVIMKIVQEIVYGIALGYTFFRWYRKERKKEEEEDLLAGDPLLHSPGNVH